MSGPVAWSVVVPSYRSEATIRACLQSVLRQDLAQPFEVIVVDSGDDETAAIVEREFPEVQLVQLPAQTEAPLARNIGVQRGRADLIAFIDSDCTAPPDWLSRLRAVLEQGYDGVGGAIANGNGETLVSWAGYICEFRESLPGGPLREAAYMTPNNVAYRREAFSSVGGFPAGCFPLEDQVFNDALRRRGARLCVDHGIVVSHRHRTDRQAFLEHQRLFGSTNAKVLRILGLPGAVLARRRWLAALALPALVPFKFVRTVVACRRLENGLVMRRPALAWLCWRGTCWWGRGFVEGAAS